jgi:hypothetical protein
VPAPGQCVEKLLTGPIAGIVDGMSGMADTSVADLSRVRQFLKSIKFRSRLRTDPWLDGLAGLCAGLTIELWALSDSIVHLLVPS